MAEFSKRRVYEKVSVEECYDRKGEALIDTRWVDLKAGESVHPEYRSRMVPNEKSGQAGGLLRAGVPGRG